ncbi:MAG: quinone-interacting membrane-bound oxidoreductase complex subunit QmoC [Planctomycetota bacterium]
MSGPEVLRPDRAFVEQILRSGGADLKKCYQCATCSVVCSLAPQERPFPRKEMLWAQWGLKDRLLADPDVWLCHQCHDCSARCPRCGRPADVLAALRRQCVEHYAVPRFLARMTSPVQRLLLMLLIPAVLLAAALLVRAPLRSSALGGVLHFFDHEGFYARLFPHWLLIGFFSFFWGLALLGAVVGLVRFWRAMKAGDAAAGRYRPVLGIWPSFVRTLGSIFRHDKFGQCTSHAWRRPAHLGALYGCAALFLVSVWAVIALYVLNPLIPGTANDLAYPFGLLNPWKLLANLGALALVGGCLYAIARRGRGLTEAGASTSFDWVFVGLLLGVGVTGLLTEILRLVTAPAAHSAAEGLAALGYVAYAVYFVHLVLVFDLLVYLPHSKFAHALYRPVALVYAEHSGRNGARGTA